MDTILTVAILAILLGCVGFVVVKSILNRRSVTGTIIEKIHTPERTVTRTRNHDRHNRLHDRLHEQDRGWRGRRHSDMSIETRTIPESWSVIVKPADGSPRVTRKTPKDQWDVLSVGDEWVD